MGKRERRFQRQFDLLGRLIPQLRGPMAALRQNRWSLLRIPAAILLILGGVLSFLPFLGIWMLPLGLLLLAVDLPALRGPISVMIIRGRLWLRRHLRRWRRLRGLRKPPQGRR